MLKVLNKIKRIKISIVVELLFRALLVNGFVVLVCKTHL